MQEAVRLKKDYIINKCLLKDIVNSVIIRNKELIVYNNIEVIYMT